MHWLLLVTGDSTEKASLRVEVYVLAACLVQFLVLPYPIGEQIPARQERQAREELVAAIRAIDADMSVPSHGYLAAMPGNRSVPAGWPWPT